MTKTFKRYADLLYTIDLVCHGVPSPEFFASFYNHETDKKLNWEFVSLACDKNLQRTQEMVNGKIKSMFRKKHI